MNLEDRLIERCCRNLDPSIKSRRDVVNQWRRNGRDYALMGDNTRSRMCHAFADYWEHPFWSRIFLPRPVWIPPAPRNL